MKLERVSHWNALLEASGQPAYLSIADAIADDMRRGRLSAGARLPPLRELAAQLQLNFTTVARGYAEAQRRGLIDSKAGQGTFIRAVLPPKSGRTRGFSDLLDMTMNLPPEPRDTALLQKMRASVARLHEHADLRALLRYQDFGGSAEDRLAGACWLAPRLPDLSPERVLVCPGAQGALLGVISLLARPGDVICTEAVTYPGIKALAAQLGIRLHGLPADDEGIDPQAFAAACGAHAPKALYCNPTLLNPTTAIYSQARREAIADIARRYSVPIIEDDAYGLLVPDMPSAFAELVPELTFYISGLAKCVGAGLRIAYLVAPDARQTQRLMPPLRAMTIMASPFNCALSTLWINEGIAGTVLNAIRKASHARQEDAATLLPNASYVSKPDAFHLWLSVPAPWNRTSFANHLRSMGVGVVAADAFTVSGTPPEAVRVCMGGAADRTDCRHMLELIGEALTQSPDPTAAGPGSAAPGLQ